MSAIQPAPPPPRSADGSTTGSSARARHNPHVPTKDPSSYQTPRRGDGALVVGGVGGRSPAAQQLLSNPQAMHDVAFYQAVAEELPTSPVVHSVLYTHRSVVDDAPTCDEAFASVNKSVTSWRSAQETQMQLEIEHSEQELSRQVEEASKEAESKELEYQRILQRMETSVAEIEGSVEKSLKHEDAQLLKSRNDMTKRHEERNRRTEEACQKLHQITEERLKAQRDLDATTSQAKLEINSTLERGLLLSEEENLRIRIRFEAANSKERIGVLEECVESSQYWEQEERQERRHLDEWAVTVHERVKRAMRALEIITSLVHHTQLSESGLRQNNTQSEQQEYLKVFGAFLAGPSAAEQIAAAEAAVYSSSATDQLDHTALSPSPTRTREFTDDVVEAFFRSFVERSEESQRLAFFINSKLSSTVEESAEGAQALQQQEALQREEIAHWLAAQEDRLLRQRRAHDIVSELVDHPVTKEHSNRLALELDERRVREAIHRNMDPASLPPHQQEM